MVSETDNTRVVSDNTVTTPLCRNLLAKFTTGEGLDKLDQRRHRVVGWSGRPEFRVHRCRDRSPSPGNLPDFGLQHETEAGFPPPVTDVEIAAAPSLAQLTCRPVDEDTGVRREDGDQRKSLDAVRGPVGEGEHLAPEHSCSGARRWWLRRPWIGPQYRGRHQTIIP